MKWQCCGIIMPAEEIIAPWANIPYHFPSGFVRSAWKEILRVDSDKCLIQV
jgi:hypothetical protein